MFFITFYLFPIERIECFNGHELSCGQGLNCYPKFYLISLSGECPEIILVLHKPFLILTIEPHAPSPEARSVALRKLADQKIKIWIFAGPIIRGINDSQDSIEKIFRVASNTGARIIFDTYVPYRGASTLMQKTVNGAGKSNAYYADRIWAGVIRDTFEKFSEEYSVRVNGEDEEWLVEYQNDFRTFT